MGKLLWFIIIIGGIYLIFFRPKKIKENKEKNESEDNLLEMIECTQCKAYVSKKEAILKDNKCYCSPKCLSDAIKA